MEPTTVSERIILKYAKEVFEEKGFNGARMQEIADKAGLNKSLLHYYFRSKEKLFDKVFEEAVSEYIPIVSTWEKDNLTWEEKIAQFTEKMIHFVEKGSMLFLVREINRNPELMSARTKNKKKPNKFIAYFEKLSAEGVIRPIDPGYLYIFINSLCCFPSINKTIFKGALNLSEKDYAVFMKRYTQMVVQFFIEGIKTK